MSEDRKTNGGEDRELSGPADGSAAGGPEALRELVFGKPKAAAKTPDTAESPDTAVTERGATEPAPAKLSVVKPTASEPTASEPVDEEDALRVLLRGVVGGIEPSGDALDRLRHAVPARRVRNHRILVAAAAAVVVLGGSVPVGLYMTSGAGGNSGSAITAGHGQTGGTAQDGSGLHQNGSARPKPKRSSGKDKDKNKDGENGASASPSTPGDFPSTGGPGVTPPRATPGSGATGAVGGGALPPPASSDVPNCTQSQVGVEGSTRAPSAGGKVYGSFRVTNVSAKGCTVRGPESLTASPASDGGAGVAVVNHVTGDAATGLLPDPSVETLKLVLAPNASYEVRFAWVPPEGGCPGANGEGGNATEGGTAGAPGAGTGTGQVQAEVPPLGAVVSHTPNTSGPDGPTTQTTIAEACGGTVYRTGVIPLR
ncbi:hypothetical protein [Streptomyces sp. NBC_01264]|uniref:hypothetical protein n=1 Tax=Streptomyces sp. NBC_01264 TaxID=2903804 RepID=UPI00224DCA40|nr:hypothetical protein [Streptomyces sp. NBC_01264]MCX4779966.1 hypothetical protein [Streptomyces sp. NBC_01264]